MYLKNTWYVACTPDEIDGKPLGRTICGEKMVFFRGPEGKAPFGPVQTAPAGASNADQLAAFLGRTV